MAVTYPPLPSCANTNLTDILPEVRHCPTLSCCTVLFCQVMESMEHDKPVRMMNRTWHCGDGVQAMVRLSLPCFIPADNTTETLRKNVCCLRWTGELMLHCLGLRERHGGRAGGTHHPLQRQVRRNTDRDGVRPLGQYCCALTATGIAVQPVTVGGAVVQYDSVQLEAGQEVELTCKEPLARPSQDWSVLYCTIPRCTVVGRYDLDPHDGRVTAVCQEDGVTPLYCTAVLHCCADLQCPGHPAGGLHHSLRPASHSRPGPPGLSIHALLFSTNFL